MIRSFHHFLGYETHPFLKFFVPAFFQVHAVAIRCFFSQQLFVFYSSLSSVATGTPARPAARRNATRPILHSLVAFPELNRPTSNSLRASINCASLASSSGGIPGNARASKGNSRTTVFISFVSMIDSKILYSCIQQLTFGSLNVNFSHCLENFLPPVPARLFDLSFSK
jgi:hypothetical protein